MNVETSGIPQYYHVITQSDVQWLNSRPDASHDFIAGSTTANVGQVVEFGESIGYSSSHCSLGYWPPGPDCPIPSSKSVNFPIQPVESGDPDCYTTSGPVGMLINGVSIYNWWDGTSYKNKDVWHTMAAWSEYYDLDLCSGHATKGDYHHHTFPNCLALLLKDNGTKKSPIYGFAADGYPIMGPFISDGLLAKSCWQTRQYDDPSSPTGCGEANKRTCLLVDQYDYSKGTVQTSNPGPDTTSTVRTRSGDLIQTSSGFYFEDHFYNSSCTEQGDEYLDEFNGRYDRVYGYVYHSTISDLTLNPDSIKSVFPHFIGPRFFGNLHSNAIVQCNTSPFPTVTCPNGLNENC